MLHYHFLGEINSDQYESSKGNSNPSSLPHTRAFVLLWLHVQQCQKGKNGNFFVASINTSNSVRVCICYCGGCKKRIYH